MLLLVKFSIASFTFCMSSRYDKYLKHVNSSEIDAEKQNKTLVQRKQITTETSPRFNLLIYHLFRFLSLKLKRMSKRIINVTEKSVEAF